MEPHKEFSVSHGDRCLTVRGRLKEFSVSHGDRCLTVRGRLEVALPKSGDGGEQDDASAVVARDGNHGE